MKLTKDSYFLFSGGEVHYRLDDTHSLGIIFCTDYTMNGFMAVCEIAEILRRKGVSQIDLIYPYFPYARQDRVMQENEPFSLKIFCDLVNSQKFNTVQITDPHSDVAPALLNNCWVVQQATIATRIIPAELFSNRNVLFVSPDAGAYKKVSKLMSDDTRIVIGVKNRDSSGKITHTDVFSSTPIAGHECVIVDDICDGGRTFVELAKTLKAKGATKIYLYVTHGIFANGFDELRKYIDVIYTTNSFPQVQAEFLKVEKIV